MFMKNQTSPEGKLCRELSTGAIESFYLLTGIEIQLFEAWTAQPATVSQTSWLNLRTFDPNPLQENEKGWVRALIQTMSLP